MSKSDIRSFFPVISKKTNTHNPPTIVKKRPKPLDSSDDDSHSTSVTVKNKVTSKSKKPKIQTIRDSDSEDENRKPKNKKIETKKVDKNKKVSGGDGFSSASIKQTKGDVKEVNTSTNTQKESNKSSKSKNKSKLQTELGIHEDSAFEQVLLDLDNDIVLENIGGSTKTNEKKNTISRKSKKNIILDSDSEDENKKPKVDKIKKVSAADVFGNAPIKQTKVEVKEVTTSTDKSKNRPKLQTELGIHDDRAFEQVLLDLDNDILLENVSELDKTIEEALNNKNTSMSNNKKENATPKTNKKRKIEDVDENDDVDKDQERHERKRHSAMLYQKYLHRSGPRNHGTKEYPKGKPGCLKALCFLRTGVLDSLEGEEFESLVKEHGGRTVQAVSKKVNYLVVGEDAGPAKLEKARGYGIPNISEDEFLDLILKKSGLPPKYARATKDEADDTTNVEEVSPKNKEKVSSPKKDDKRTVISPRKASENIEKNSNKSPVKNKVKLPESKKPNLKNLKKDIKEEDDTKTAIKKKDIKSENIEFEKEDKKQETSSKSGDVPEGKITKQSFYGKKDDESVKKVKKEIKISEKEKEEDDSESNNENLLWADRYKPTNLKAIIGQQGDKSPMNKLLNWLKKWPHNHLGKMKPKLAKPTPWAKNDDGAYFKCALLSGPPGIGKTTTATLVAKELGYHVLEFNASDTRSKKLLHEVISESLTSKSVTSYCTDKSTETKKHLVLMDEVDGMAGNEDRGGVQELIALIKNTNVPIICMCNDRNHQKMRSLVNYCFDLRLSKPNLNQITGAMMSVCCREGVKIQPAALHEIIRGTDMDIRQTLNHLSIWTVDNNVLSPDMAKEEAQSSKKDTALGPWEVIRKVFTEEDQKTMSIGDKFRLFFYDYSLGPLFVQENYLNVEPHCKKSDVLQRAADAADSISMSDIVDRKMRSRNNWSLLEVQAIFSSVLPGHYMSGHFNSSINFPGWLGKNSRKNKMKRLVSELQSHTRACTSASRKSVNLDYVYHWRNNIVDPLKENGVDGVEESLNVMHSYNLLRQDLDNILEVSHWARQKDPMSMVDTKVKTALTRTYNKINAKLPYRVDTGAVKKKVVGSLNDDLLEEDDAEVSAEDDDDVTKDAMIKKKNPTKTKTGDSKASSSKKSSGKGGKKTK